jgi:hypothetical protein
VRGWVGKKVGSKGGDGRKVGSKGDVGLGERWAVRCKVVGEGVGWEKDGL